ncbi:hypothetical protein CLI64_23980 [Nostoc sp. CENA543]|uniref:hypothetical protein n=1 Tax=Nostoc sp. CENA543 TaxID=1869241 RepID=UPI000CA2373A|nr:hypothetical protein [Nostoc sp. CENA543]AUT03223.1 hypothetical protein CLI64_23980 [Nostoc sp. CENA543]
MNKSPFSTHKTTNSIDTTTKQIVDRIIRSGKMSSQDHHLLTSTVFSHHRMSDEARRQINRVFDYIQSGQLKLID